MMQVIQQYRQIKQNPNQLASFLQQKGMINQQQAKEIQSMGGNFDIVGQYLMNQGSMPQNVEQYQNQVQEIQNAINQQSNS